MQTSRPIPVRSAVAACAALAAFACFSAPASADEHRGGHDRHERYENRNWVYDGRYHHDHYYPARGYAVSVLPPGYLSLNFRGGRFFFQAGVWFAPGPGGYVVVQPPLGMPAPMLPPGYATVWSHGVPYYYANDVYYVQGPGGYVVSQPPADANLQAVPQSAPQGAMSAPPPPQAAPAAPAQPGAGVWYYCESAKAYYPYASSCAEGWRTVPAAPPPR